MGEVLAFAFYRIWLRFLAEPVVALASSHKTLQAVIGDLCLTVHNMDLYLQTLSSWYEDPPEEPEF